MIRKQQQLGSTPVRVSGTKAVYKLDRVQLLYLLACQTLNDISGPTSVIDDATKPETVCVAANAGECRSGSAQFDIFYRCGEAGKHILGLGGSE